MGKRFKFIAVIHNLSLEENTTIQNNDFIITNTPSHIYDIITYNSDLALSTLGVHSIDEFIGNTFCMRYGEFDPSISIDDINRCGTQVTFAFLRQLESFVNQLWYIKDNAVYSRDGFLFVYDENIDDGVTFKGSLSEVISCASTQVDKINFSREEILQALNNTGKISINEIFESDLNFRIATQFQYFKNSGLDRKSYAFLYIHFARAHSSMALKILMYVTAMEALVSTSTTELSHQVSERVAILIGDNPIERNTIYKTIKKSYNLRSKAAHGDFIKGDQEEVANLLVLIDNYLRRLMKLEQPYMLNSDNMNQYFIDKLLA